MKEEYIKKVKIPKIGKREHEKGDILRKQLSHVGTLSIVSL
jgi:hypothetical protein